jgi:hypothetical protein
VRAGSLRNGLANESAPVRLMEAELAEVAGGTAISSPAPAPAQKIYNTPPSPDRDF